MGTRANRLGGSEAAASSAQLPAGDPKDLGFDILAALFIAGDGLAILDRHLRCVFANPAACTLLGCGLNDLHGRGFLTCLGLNQPHVRDGLAAGKPGRWEAVLRRPDGSELDILCAATRLDGLGEDLMVVSLQDDSERRRQAREAAALAQAAASAADDSVDATVQALAESALRGTRALGTVMLFDEEDEVAAWIGTAGMPDGYADSVRALFRAGCPPPAVHEKVVAGGRILIDPDGRRRVESDPKLAGASKLIKSVPWHGLVIAPLMYQGAIVGTLSALYREGELPLSEGEMTFLETLVDQAAVVAMNARLMTAARSKVALDERQRLSRELHDSVSQALYGIALGARTARDLAGHDCPRVVPPIDYVLQLAETGMAEMRALIFELRPESLETEGLVAALGKQAEAIQARHGITVRTATCEEPDASLEVKQALYRIAQEALQNTVKHAQAGSVEVCLQEQDGGVLLAIQDDGVGFDPDGTFPGHLGLRSMRERALGLGGSLEVASVPGHGTRIAVSVPRSGAGMAGLEGPS